MSATIERSPLTEALLDQLNLSNWLVGDGVIPDASWLSTAGHGSQGQPEAPDSEFEPFAVLAELRASDSSGSIGDSQADWRMPYMVESFGVSREQAGSLRDALRTQLEPLRGTRIQLGASKYKVQQIRTDAIGVPIRFDVTSPPFWHVQDGLTVWLAKSRLS